MKPTEPKPSRDAFDRWRMWHYPHTLGQMRRSWAAYQAGFRQGLAAAKAGE